MTCDEIREQIHEARDADGADGLSEPIRAHLAACDACREFQDDLEALSSALVALPRVPLPADALEAVWRETVDARPRWLVAGTGVWRLAAAASLVAAVSATTLFFLFAPVRPPKPSVVELARASAQAELVFGYTARALAATRAAAADRVLASKVSPAVRGAAASHAPRRP